MPKPSIKLPKNVLAISKKAGVSYGSLLRTLKKGYSIDESLYILAPLRFKMPQGSDISDNIPLMHRVMSSLGSRTSERKLKAARKNVKKAQAARRKKSKSKKSSK